MATYARMRSYRSRPPRCRILQPSQRQLARLRKKHGGRIDRTGGSVEEVLHQEEGWEQGRIGLAAARHPRRRPLPHCAPPSWPLDCSPTSRYQLLSPVVGSTLPYGEPSPVARARFLSPIAYSRSLDCSTCAAMVLRVFDGGRRRWFMRTCE